jgi:hypothetical protein
MPISSTQPSLRARVLPRFPANVLAGNGITITRNGGAYVFAVTTLINVAPSVIGPISTDVLLGRDSPGSGNAEEISVGAGLQFTSAGSVQLSPNQRLRAISLVLPAMAANLKQDYIVPFACTITRVTVLADVVGSCVLDIWKAAYGSFPPVVGNSITAAAKPTISSVQKYQDAVLTGWTKSIAANDVLRVNVDSVTTIGRVTLCLEVNVT